MERMKSQRRSGPTRGRILANNKNRENLRRSNAIAAERVGEDGKGRNGFVGYLSHVALTHPTSLGSVLCQPLRMQEAIETAAGCPARGESQGEVGN